MADGLLALTWNNHSSTFLKTLSTVRTKERYTDVTLSCDGRFYQLHKLVLSTCSEYFEKIFEQTPCKHPVIVLRDVSCDELEALLNYMYLGSVSVVQNDLARLIKVAELFQIKGLAVPDEPPKASDSAFSKRHENRDSRNSASSSRENASELQRTRRCVSDGQDSPLPKRARHAESYMDSDSISHGADGVPPTSERLGTLDVGEGAGIRRRESAASGESTKFDFQIKEEIVHDVLDSDTESHDTGEGYSALNDQSSLGGYEPTGGESQPYVAKSEPDDIPSDEQSLDQPMLENEPYNEQVMTLPGPSDAQGWYSEGDSSGGGMPIGEGGIGDKSHEMLPLEMSQQQSQQPMVMRGIPSEVGNGSEKVVKMYHCHLCLYSTRNRAHLKHHLPVHTGERPYVCSFCPASFTFKGSMRRHERTHTGEKPFTCHMCPYRSTQHGSLLLHMKKHLH